MEGQGSGSQTGRVQAEVNHTGPQARHSNRSGTEATTNPPKASTPATADRFNIKALTHFWFVTIPPFEDGNGRIARAIADMALARADGTG